MVRLVALDRVLGIVFARVVDIALVVHVPNMHLDNSSAQAPGLRVPADVITELEFPGHGWLLTACRADQSTSSWSNPPEALPPPRPITRRMSEPGESWWPARRHRR